MDNLKDKTLNRNELDLTANSELAEAFDYLYPYIVSEVNKLGVADSDIDDIIQEVVLQIFSNKERLFRREILGKQEDEISYKSLTNYAKAITRNIIHRRFRNFKSREQLSNIYSEVDNFEKPKVLEFENELTQPKKIEMAIKKLDIESQEFLKLYYSEGFTLKEISKKLNINENIIRTKKYRLIKRLQQLLKEENKNS